jgi:hypothetical protein
MVRKTVGAIRRDNDDVKSEGRNPKAERRPKPEIRKLGLSRSLKAAIRIGREKAQKAQKCSEAKCFRSLDFGLLSTFGLRISDFTMPHED